MMTCKIKANAGFSVNKISNPGINAVIKNSTLWEWEHFRKTRSGLLEKIDEWNAFNVITTQGFNYLLDVCFHGTTACSTWYVTMFEDNYTPLTTDTYQTPGFNEIDAADTVAGARVAFVEAAASNAATTNSANKASITMNGSLTVYGGALMGALDGGGASPSTFGDVHADGRMFCASKFAAPKSVVPTDVLMVACTITFTDV